MHTCNSCGKGFTYSGFTCHGLRASNPICRQAYQTAILNQCNLSSDSDSDTAPADQMESDNDHDDLFSVDFEPHFETNASEHEDRPMMPNTAYGSCGESDWEDSDDDEDLNQSESVVADALPLDATVQALPESYPTNDPDTDDRDIDEPMDDPNVDTRDDGRPNLPHIFVQTFTHGRAGAPVNGIRISADQHYQSNLTPNGASNIYAPFASKLDWEFAKWAKSSSISSTAITNLLKIEGVRPAVRLTGGAMTRPLYPRLGTRTPQSLLQEFWRAQSTH